MGRGFAEAGRREGEAARARGTCLELATHSLCAGTNHILSQGLFPAYKHAPLSLRGHPCSCPPAVWNPPPTPGWARCLFAGAARLFASGLALTVWAALRRQRDLLKLIEVTSPHCSRPGRPHLMLSDITTPHHGPSCLIPLCPPNYHCSTAGRSAPPTA